MVVARNKKKFGEGQKAESTGILNDDVQSRSILTRALSHSSCPSVASFSEGNFKCDIGRLMVIR
jgi:hypothetical protein